MEDSCFYQNNCYFGSEPNKGKERMSDDMENNSDDTMDELGDIVNNMMLEYENIIACVNIQYVNERRGENIDYHFEENEIKIIEETVTNDVYERVFNATGSCNIRIDYLPLEDVVFDMCLYKKVIVKVYYK
jgi:hypothetical protein